MDFTPDNMTVQSALSFGKSRLSAVGVGQAEALQEAGYLLSSVLGEDRVILLAFGERVLSASEVLDYQRGLQQRVLGKPLALICGEKEFYGLDFACGFSLIPRPDSEALVDLALSLLPKMGSLRILDIGCGSGCLGISVAVACGGRTGRVSLTLADADEQALSCARQNAVRHLGEDVALLVSNWFSAIEGEFDMILCNPPYVASDDLLYLPRGVRCFEPPQALCGGDSGLQAYELLAEQVLPHLRAGGCLVLEIGSGQRQAVKSLFSSAGLAFVQEADDLSGVCRALAFQRSP